MFQFQTCNERIILLVRQLELIMTPQTIHFHVFTDHSLSRLFIQIS